MATGPLTQHDRDQVAELHAAGKTRNDIARILGRSPSTVTRVARQLGLSFDRSATQAATAAKVADARERRAQLSLDLLADAQRLRAQMWQPATYWDWGGKNHTYDEKTKPEPTPSDKAKLIQAAATASRTSTFLDEYDCNRDHGAADVDAWLDHMTGQAEQ